jgi:phosphonate transport system ATP-binding protein
MLEFRNVTRRFGDVTAVDNVSLAIAPGQMVGVIGRSGAGKSTLLRMVNRLCEPTSGEIYWGRQTLLSLRGRELRSWRRRCAMIFQQFNLVPRLDVITNVLMGALSDRTAAGALFKVFPAADRARAVLELDRLGIVDKALTRAQLLSGGQQQRVAIARALMQQPDIILADEPVASLDPFNAEVVMRALEEINRTRGITVIVNLHALDLARRYCTRIIGMSSGRVVFDGLTSELTSEATSQIYAREEFARPALQQTLTESAA